MTIKDKNGILSRIGGPGEFILELGCGERKRIKNSIGIDAIDYDGVDIVGDVNEVLDRMPSESVSAVYSHHFVEHVDDVKGLLSKMARVLRRGGLLEVVVPHFSNPYFYSDLTHRVFFGLYSFSYSADDKQARRFSRKVPTYNQEAAFDLVDVKIVFKSAPPFYLRHGFKKLLELLFNLNSYTKEFYEENLCYIFPCYELKFRLVKKQR